VALALNRSITIEIENFIEETEKKIRLEKAGVRHD
tara:strand:- start:6220 stop:6324 length:105 start_codon:yes stop_codon:yes gene_type:complete